MEFRLPDLGEGIEIATVTSVAVQSGATVTAQQTLFEVETDKTSVSIPAPSAGTVTELRVKTGDKIKIGQVVAVFAASGAKPAAPVAPPPAPAKAAPAKPASGNGTHAVSPSPPAPASTAPQRVEFRLPDPGEGIQVVTVVSIAVQAGETVAAQQTLFEVETDKASLPVPAPMAGKVEEVRIKAGDKINVGQVVAVLTVQASAAPAVVPAAVAKRAQSVPVPSAPAKPTTAPTAPTVSSKLVAAGPATRRLARELGVDLGQVTGSARGSRITIDDVKNFVKDRLSKPAPAPTGGSFVLPPLPDFSKYGVIEKKPVSTLRKKIAENLTLAWHACPMVTQYDHADITDLEAGRKRIADAVPKGAPKVTMTILAIKAVVAALKAFPNFNTSYDAANGELIYKKYYNIGIAVDTERGLMVPVVKDADKKSITDLAKEVNELAEKTRAGKLAVDDMRGGTFTISNLGGIGGTAFSPIVNYPEVAILGMARSALTPVVRDGKIEPRLLLPLCLSYDHRVVDGADGARFTARLAQLFSDPIRLLLES